MELSDYKEVIQELKQKVKKKKTSENGCEVRNKKSCLLTDTRGVGAI